MRAHNGASRRAAVVGLLSALAIATNFAMIGIPNVKLMDSIVFIAGLSLGLIDGVAVATLTWLIYGFFNPYGFIPTIWIATIVGEWMYALAGWLSRSLTAGKRPPRVILAALGFSTTLAYDLLTNVVFALTFGFPVEAALIAGIPFALLHELTNAAAFSILVPKAEAAVGALLGLTVEGRPVKAVRAGRL
ncbi:MAG: hypothetical protein QI223_06620 [Candidatus Korarchaeota archaeon]|nr:hypothetical protein [Candidatus Korarchaeota archaeon]